MATPLRISAADGYALGATIFGASHRHGPVVIISAATGVRQRYYARFAGWLAARGATVVTFDYRGIGDSRPHRLRGFHARMRDWGELDLDGVLSFAHREWRGRELVSLGHSVGGQLLGLPRSNVVLSRALTIGAQSGFWGHWPGVSKLAMAGLWFGLMPVATSAVGYFPGRLGVGEDLPAGVAHEWARWCRQPGFFTDDGVSTDGFERLAIPIQAWSFADDAFAPRRAVDWLHRLFTRAAVERVHVSPVDAGVEHIGHFGFFRTGVERSLWPRAAAFLEQGGVTRHPHHAHAALPSAWAQE